MGLYVITIAEHVTGKSKGPTGYTRAKPIKYPSADVPHPIVYWKKVTAASDEDAMKIAKDAAKEMFKIYSLNLGSAHSKVMEYTVALHNVDTDTPETIFSTVSDLKATAGLLYDTEYVVSRYRRHRPQKFKVKLSNKVLEDWKIIRRARYR